MSNQIVRTPVDFIYAVEQRFGTITWDLAANSDNCQVNDDREAYFGPESKHGENAFLQEWQGLGGLAWLNPPFADIEPWARKCAESFMKYRQRIALLIPAGVCTNYVIDYVKPFAYVFECTPRPFKKEVRDVILALYEPSHYVGRETWRWR